MNRIKTLLVYWTVYGLVGCGKNDVPAFEYKNVQIDFEQSKEQTLSTIFSGIEYLLLDYNDTLPMVRPFRVRLERNDIFIQDNGLENLFHFDGNGRLLNIFQSKGIGGPGEFMSMEDFQIKGDTVIIGDSRQNQLVFYNFNGDFLFSKRFTHSLNEFYYTPNGLLLHMNNLPEIESNNFVKIEDDTLKGWLKIREGFEKMTFRSVAGFYKDKYRNEVLFNIPFSYDIAFFDNNGELSRILGIEPLGSKIDDKLRIEMRSFPNKNEYIRENRLCPWVTSFFPFEDMYFMVLQRGWSEKHYFILDDNFDVVFQAKNLENDLDGMKIRNVPWTFSDQKVIFMINSMDFYNDFVESEQIIKNEYPNSSVHKFVQENASQLLEDKTVLVFLTIKEQYQH